MMDAVRCLSLERAYLARRVAVLAEAFSGLAL